MTSGSAGCLASLLLALFLTSSEHPASARTIRVFTMLLDIVIAGAAGVRPDLPVSRAVRIPPCASHVAASIPSPPTPPVTMY